MNRDTFKFMIQYMIMAWLLIEGESKFDNQLQAVLSPFYLIMVIKGIEIASDFLTRLFWDRTEKVKK